MTSEPVNVRPQGVNTGGRPGETHPVYLPENSAARNPVLNQQFAHFLGIARKSSLDSETIISFLKAQPYLKENGVNVIVHPSRWPAAYQPATNNIVINPDLLRLGKSNPEAMAFATTEIFDQVIYAQLYAQAKNPDAIGIVCPPTPDALGRLIDIKADKQDAIKVSVMGSVDDSADGGAPRMLIDPYSAWLLASPQHVVESWPLKHLQMQCGTA